MKAKSLAILLLSGLLPGCVPIFTCADDLRQRIDPPSVTLNVGDEVRATAQFLGCTGRKELDDEITWTSADPAVASVEAATGRIVGRGAGTTTVTPRGAVHGVVQHVMVTVR